jgi:hypothetical protein
VGQFGISTRFIRDRSYARGDGRAMSGNCVFRSCQSNMYLRNGNIYLLFSTTISEGENRRLCWSARETTLHPHSGDGLNFVFCQSETDRFGSHQ